jgi:glycosyltransferase involved in cell wall biosynthesis
MKILLVQDTDWIRRNPMQHNHIAERLVLKGHEVRVIDYEILWRTEGKKALVSPRRVFTVSRILKNANHTVVRPSILRIPVLDYVSMLFTYTREIKRQLNEFKPDLLYLDTILTAYLAFRIAKRRNIKTIYYCIDVAYEAIPFKLLRPLGKFMESANMKSADRVFSINQKLKDYTVHMGAKSANTRVLRASVDCRKFDPSLDGIEIRKQYGFKSEDKVLFFMGWLYNFSGLTEVASELAKIQDPLIKLFIIGDGDAFESLQKIKITKGLDGRIVLAGRVDYDLLPNYIAAADLCLLPAYNNDVMRDIVPIKLYEYMAMGKPVISTKLPGVMAEFGEYNGVVYVDKPEDTLAKAIEIFKDGKVKEYGYAARKFVNQYSWESITDEFEKEIKNLVGEK